MEDKRRLSRRDFLRLTAAMATGALAAACAPATPQIVEVEKEVPVEKVVKETVVVEKEVVVEKPAKPPEKVEISFARHGSESDLDIEHAVAAIFKEDHPDITVKDIVLPWTDYNQKIPVMVAGGTAPDVFGCHPALLFETYAAEGLVPIDSYVESDAELNYDDIVFHGDAEFEGHIVGLPQKSCTHQLRFNKKLFEEAGLPTPADLYWEDREEGWNWNSFVELLKQLTVDLNGDGEIDQYGFGSMGGCNILSIIRSAGGDVLDDVFHPTKCVLDAPESKKGFQFMVDLVRKYKVQPPPELKLAELGIEFSTGKIGITGATTCDQVRDLRPGFELPFDWEFVVLPAGAAGFRAWGDTDQMVISSASPNKDACYEWMRFRCSKEAWERLYDEFGISLAFTDGPQRWSIFETAAYREPLAAIDVDMIIEGYKYVIPDPYLPRTPAAYRIFFTIVTTELDNAMRGSKTVDEAIADACKLIDEALAEG